MFEPHIVDAIKILHQASERVHDVELAFGGLCSYDHDEARRTINRAIRYLANPERFARPKRGRTAVKTGKSRNPKRHLGRKNVVSSRG